MDGAFPISILDSKWVFQGLSNELSFIFEFQWKGSQNNQNVFLKISYAVIHVRQCSTKNGKRNLNSMKLRSSSSKVVEIKLNSNIFDYTGSFMSHWHFLFGLKWHLNVLKIWKKGIFIITKTHHLIWNISWSQLTLFLF